MTVLRLLIGRYLLGLRRRTHVAAVSAISLTAMTLGAAALVITLALLEGFQSTIRRQLTESGVHAELRPRRGAELPGGEWLAELRRRHPQLEVRGVSSGAVWCLVSDAAVPAELEVVDTLTTVEVNRVLAARLAAGAGSQIVVAGHRLVLTPLGPAPAQSSLVVGRVIASRPNDDRSVLRVPPALARGLLGTTALQRFELRDAEPARAWAVASDVQADVPEEVEVVSFADLNRPLLAALQLERVMIGLGVGLVIAVAALNLLCNLALLAAEKRNDVAVLAALGLEPRHVTSLFLTLGLVIGFVGGVLGVGVGGLVAFVLDRTAALPLPRGVFIVSHVPFSVTPGAVATVLAVSLGAALLASLAPARAAARRDVLEGLRYE
jgi:lipoprotein-releasing system permease protein